MGITPFNEDSFSNMFACQSEIDVSIVLRSKENYSTVYFNFCIKIHLLCICEQAFLPFKALIFHRGLILIFGLSLINLSA